MEGHATHVRSSLQLTQKVYAELTRLSDTFSIEESYPFTDAVDYRSFVVQCAGNLTHPEDMSSIPHCLDDILLADPAIIQQKQRALQRNVVKVLYGVGQDAHRYDDAFAQLIRQLRMYLDNHVSAAAVSIEVSN
jgi:hypothetical protein